MSLNISKNYINVKDKTLYIRDDIYKFLDCENSENLNKNIIILLDHVVDIVNRKKIIKIVFLSIFESVDVSYNFLFHEKFIKFYESYVNKIQFYFIFGTAGNLETYDSHYIYNDFYYWPHIFLYEIDNESSFWTYNSDVTLNNQSKFITLNNMARNHRVKFIDFIAKHNIWDKGVVSLNQLPSDLNDFKYWDNPRKLQLDMTNENYIDGRLDTKSPINSLLFERLPKQYYNAKIDIVTETSEHEFQYSEKTIRPLLLQKPFIIVGTKGINKMLSELFGFKLYDEIFNYEYYDNLDKLDNRLDYLCEWIKNKSIVITDATKKKLLYNKNLVDKLRKKETFFIDSNHKKINEKDFCNLVRLHPSQIFGYKPFEYRSHSNII